MSKTKGRTGARDRANIAPPPTPEAIDAARREVAQCEGKLVELASGHPSTKVWRTRLKAAQAVLARVR